MVTTKNQLDSDIVPISSDQSNQPDTVNPENGNIIKVCISCGERFVFDTGEQEFFRSREFDPPKRCPLCRKWKKFKNSEREAKEERTRIMQMEREQAVLRRRQSKGVV